MEFYKRKKLLFFLLEEGEKESILGRNNSDHSLTLIESTGQLEFSWSIMEMKKTSNVKISKIRD